MIVPTPTSSNTTNKVKHMQPQNTITLHQPTVGATLGSPYPGCSPWHAHPTLIKFRKYYRAKYSLIVQNTAHPSTSSIPKIYRAKHSLFPKNTAHPCKTLTKGSGAVAKWASRSSPMFPLAPSSQHSQTLSLKISAVPGNMLTMPHCSHK